MSKQEFDRDDQDADSMFDFLADNDQAGPPRRHPAAAAGDRPMPIIRKPVPVSRSGPLLPPRPGAPVEPPPPLTDGGMREDDDFAFLDDLPEVALARKVEVPPAGDKPAGVSPDDDGPSGSVPSAVDLSRVGPSRGGPSSIDPSRVDPSSIDPSRVDNVTRLNPSFRRSEESDSAESAGDRGNDHVSQSTVRPTRQPTWRSPGQDGRTTEAGFEDWDRSSETRIHARRHRNPDESTGRVARQPGFPPAAAAPATRRIRDYDELDLGLDDTLGFGDDWHDGIVATRSAPPDEDSGSPRRGRWLFLAVLLIGSGVVSFLYTQSPDLGRLGDRLVEFFDRTGSSLGPVADSFPEAEPVDGLQTDAVPTDLNAQETESADATGSGPVQTVSPLMQRFRDELARVEALVAAGSLDEAEQEIATMDRTVYGYGAFEFSSIEKQIEQLRTGELPEPSPRVTDLDEPLNEPDLLSEQAALGSLARQAAQRAAKEAETRLASRAAQVAQANRAAEQAAQEEQARQAEQAAQEEQARQAEQAAREEQARQAEQAAREEAERLEQERAAEQTAAGSGRRGTAQAGGSTVDSDRLATDRRIAEERAALQRQQARQQRLADARATESARPAPATGSTQASRSGQTSGDAPGTEPSGTPAAPIPPDTAGNRSGESSSRPASNQVAMVNRTISDEDLQLVYRRFVDLQNAIRTRDINAVVGLTQRSGVRVQQFMQIFENSTGIDARIRNVSTRNATGEIQGTLQISGVKRADGSVIGAPPELSSISLSSKWEGNSWSAIAW